jgi:hypothetical protein
VEISSLTGWLLEVILQGVADACGDPDTGAGAQPVYTTVAIERRRMRRIEAPFVQPSRSLCSYTLSNHKRRLLTLRYVPESI